MQLKSKIQLIQERLMRKNSFIEGLNNIMEKYTIEDSVFSYENSHLMEVCKGYFELDCEYESLTEAMKEMDIDNQSIRIINNDTFQVGSVRRFISECGEGKVFDLELLENVERC